MTSPQTQSKVINLLRELVLATIDGLCNKLSKSRMTVLRALKSYGYFSSFNFNSSYFTLKDTPDFDAATGYPSFRCERLKPYA